MHLGKYQRNVKFNQIISNIPAKVGREQLSIILYDAFDALNREAKLQ
jgi:hypothetical protein